MDHITGLHDLVGRAVTAQHQVVKVEAGQQAVSPAQLHRAETTGCCGAAGAHQCAQHGGQAGDGIGSGLDDCSTTRPVGRRVRSRSSSCVRDALRAASAVASSPLVTRWEVDDVASPVSRSRKARS
jgi:hypothetical protein